MSLSEPRGKIEIDGTLFDSFKDRSLFTALKVELTTNQASMAEFSVFDPDFGFLDGYSLTDGVPLSVCRCWLGYGPDINVLHFKGLLSSVDYGDNITTLRFYDMGLKMRLMQKTEYHKGLDIDVIKKLVTRNGLKFEGPGSGFKGVPLQSKKQEAQTDWSFALRLAEEAGLVLYVKEDTVFAKPAARTGDPVLSLSRRDVFLLEPTDLHYKLPENQEGRPSQVELRARGKGGKRLTGRSDKNQRGHQRTIIKHSIRRVSQLEINNRAVAKKELRREHAFACRVQTILPPSMRVSVRDTVELVNMGKLFSGKYLVDTASFELASGGLKTDLDLYRDAKVS